MFPIPKIQDGDLCTLLFIVAKVSCCFSQEFPRKQEQQAPDLEIQFLMYVRFFVMPLVPLWSFSFRVGFQL